MQFSTYAVVGALAAAAALPAGAQGASGSYVGDCFEYVDPLTKQEATLAVTGQKSIDDGKDMELTVIPGEVVFLPLPTRFGCRPLKLGAEPVRRNVSDLESRGARRYGWAYGALTMPYKYYPGAREFEIGVPIGGYLGYRIGRMGSGYTIAGALTLSQVKADTLDPNKLDANGRPTVTGTTDVAALSWAMGLVFDVGKDPRTKPFKAGLFVGQDRVNQSPSVSYKHNGKTYIALQLGFDFTE